MKIEIRKYTRLLDAQSKIYSKLSKLTCMGSDWQKERDQTEKLNQKNSEYQNKLDNLSLLITQEDFEEYLSDRMCCSWEDFKN